MKLRGLPKDQMLIAEKIINETLFEAEMGKLTLFHSLSSQPAVSQIQQQFSHYQYQTPSTFSHPNASTGLQSPVCQQPQLQYQQQENCL